MIHQYQNSGLFYNSDQTGGFQTILVIGYERSGTSMVAGILHRLGIFIGDDFQAPVYEDARLGDAIRNKKNYLQIIEQYNQRHRIWGLKRPVCNRAILKNLKRFSRPLIIHICRDPVAVSARTSQAYSRGFERDFLHNFQAQLRLSKAIGKITSPILYCSYEKILASPEVFVDQLVRILALPPIEKRLYHAIINSIKPGPREYLQACTPFTGVIGFIDSIDGAFVNGWAAHRSRQKQKLPVALEIWLNQKKLTEVCCNRFRDDLLENKIHPTGHCAFRVELPRSLDRQLDILELKPANEDYCLPRAEGFTWH